MRQGVWVLLAAVIAACGSEDGARKSPPNANVSVSDFRQNRVDKIDVLFMIDNSASMADKQLLLADAVPQLLNRLITPVLDPVTGKAEFEPVVDIHIGIVSSSLGGHGGDQCSETGQFSNPTQYDNAHLIGQARPGLTSYQSLGFLWWDPTGQKGAAGPGEADKNKLQADFAAQVTATGESGCGYEAQLESWYRFLVDPAPPAKVEVVDEVAQLQGVDDVVLQQRKDFLRPDSLVAIIMLSDENDCSVVDGGYNWIAAQTSNPNNTAFHLPRGTSACAQDPDSPCCRSCNAADGAPPAGCGPLASDPECQKGAWDDQGDHPNLRCWQQKKRFGLEFLYPTRRYVEALTQSRICPVWDANGPVGCQFDDPYANGYRVCNPLFAKDLSSPGSCETGSRDPALVYIAGIVGVPWQDLATPETLADKNKLTYRTASKLNWDWLVPQCSRTVDQNKLDPGNKLPRPVAICDKWDLADPPDDALMIESTEPRTGTNPALDLALAPPSAGPLANAVNGHEWLTADGDLQYACIFKLPTTKDCDAATGGCDCDDVGPGYTANNPLCQDGSGQYSKLQGWAKAFPGTRELQVLKDYGDNSIVASICPKLTDDKSNPSYGYNPAVDAIIDRLREVLAGQCVNRPIMFPPGPDGKPDTAHPPCAVIEVQPKGAGSCGACNAVLNRSDVDPAWVKPILSRLEQTGHCKGSACSATNYCMCEIDYVKDRPTCEQTGAQPDNYGWCYVDPAQGIGNPALVQACDPPRQLIFSGNDTPAAGSGVFVACTGAAGADPGP